MRFGHVEGIETAGAISWRVADSAISFLRIRNSATFSQAVNGNGSIMNFAANVVDGVLACSSIVNRSFNPNSMSNLICMGHFASTAALIARTIRGTGVANWSELVSARVDPPPKEKDLIHLGQLRLLCAVIIAVGTALIGLMNPSAGAEELRLEYLALRGGFTGYVIGQYQPDYFNQADVALAARLPWQKELGADWIVGTRALFSAGVLIGAHEMPGIFTLIPFYVLCGRKDGLISIDIGGGGALVTEYKFQNQNFGGPFQFVWTFGATSRFAGPIGVGYHFQHFSDAGMYGSDARGVDMHLFELTYWFDTK